MKTKTSTLIAIATMSGQFCGCAKGGVTPVEVPGTYKGKYSEASEVLVLRSDGKFVQIVNLRSNTNTFRAEGTWTFDPKGQEIIFDDRYLLTFDPGQTNISAIRMGKESVCPRPISHWFGKVRIGTSESITYVKQKDKPYDPVTGKPVTQ